MVWAEVLESYIIYKYIERTQLSNFWDITPYLKEISNLIVKLHSYGLASNDIWSENFILDSKGRLKIIDLSDNGFLSICQAMIGWLSNDSMVLKQKIKAFFII